MDCIKVKQFLSAYLDSQLSKQEMNFVREHLSKCQGCSLEYDKLKKAVGLVSSLKEVEPPPDFLKRLHTRLEHPSPFQEFLRRLFTPWKIKLPLEGLAVALVALLVIKLTQGPEMTKIVREPEFLLRSSEISQPVDDKAVPPEAGDLKMAEKLSVLSSNGILAKKRQGKKELDEISKPAAELREVPKEEALKEAKQLFVPSREDIAEYRTKTRAGEAQQFGIKREAEMEAGADMPVGRMLEERKFVPPLEGFAVTKDLEEEKLDRLGKDDGIRARRKGRSLAKAPLKGQARKTGGKAMDIKITSTAFEEGGMIPKKYTCDGEDISPPLSWTSPPEGTKAIALISDDPDAPVGTWVHWVIYNIPPQTRELSENIPPKKILPNGARQGMSDFRRIGYGGPCPPGGTHRYYFKIYALDIEIGLGPGATKKDLLKAMEGHILAQGQLMGRYKRTRRLRR